MVLNIAMLSIHSSPIGELGTQDTGGMSVYVRELAKKLGRRGHCIDIFTQHNPCRHERVVDLYDNVRLIHLSGGTRSTVSKRSLYGYLPQLFHDLESFKIKESIEYDILHSHYWLSGVLGAMAQSSWDIHHLLTYHTMGAVKQQACSSEHETKLRLTSERRLAGVCDGLVVATQKEKEYLSRFDDVSDDKITVIPCGVDLHRFKPLDKLSARRQLGFSGDDFMVLYVGRYAPVKGLHRLLETVGRLTHLPGLRLVMVGGDGSHSPMFQQLQSEAKAMNIQNHITFAGKIKQKTLPQYYNAADVLAVPSYYESFGLVALEALACGTPVVTTPVGAMEKIVEDGVNGYVATDSDPKHFARLIEAIWLKKQQNHLSPSKIRGSVTEFTWARSASLLLEVYRSALNGQRINFKMKLPSASGRGIKNYNKGGSTCRIDQK
jgi:D-inositol-3-phosphate glycosyltransferase